MMVISGITIYVLISLINLLVVPLINTLPPFLRTFIVSPHMATIMTYYCDFTHDKTICRLTLS